MKISDWNEVSDSFVDGELSDEEKSQVSGRASSDAALREEIEWASELHEKLAQVARVGRPLPDGFSDRLLKALNDSPAWSQYGGAVGPERAEPRAWRRAFPILVAACVVVAVVAAAVAGFANLRKSVEAPENKGWLAEHDSTPVAIPEFETQPLIMTPSPEGNAPESVATKPSQSQLWTVVSFNDESQLEERVFKFQQSCKEQKVDFKKFGGDREFLLERVKPSQWRVVSEGFADSSVSIKTSEALTKWGAAKDESVKTKNLRVTFDATSVGDSERIEE